MARTAFYANRNPLFTLDDIKTELVNLSSDLAKKVDDAQTQLSEKSDNIETNLNKLNKDLVEKVDDAQTKLSEKSDNLGRRLDDIKNTELHRLEKSIGLIQNDTKALLQQFPTISPILKEQAEKVYLCLRAINRIEDYIIDKDFKKDEGTKNLQTAAPDKLAQDALECLKGNVELHDEYLKLYHSFETGDIQERNGRLDSCQKLRLEIIRYFAAQQPMDQDGSPSSDQAPPVPNGQ